MANWIHIYKGFQLVRAWRSKSFSYGGESLPPHVTNYDMARKFIDKYLIPKMCEIGLYKKDWNPFIDEIQMFFPYEHRKTMADEIKKNRYYYKDE